MALFGLLAGLLVPMLLSLIPLLLVLIGQAKTNNKAGRPGWHAIIPFLSQYTRAAIGGNIKNFWMLLASVGISSVLGILGTVLNEVLGQTIALMIALTSLPFGIAAIVFAIKIENGVARAFGKGKGFTAGLIFLPFIFNPILGFSNVGYNGEIPVATPKAPKEPKPKKEKAPKPAKEPKAKKEPKVKKEKRAKGQKAPEVHPEPEEEVEPPRPEFKPQYDMGDEEEEAPATPRMTMDQMMLQSLKAKKTPPPPPVEEPKPVVEKPKAPEKPSNRFSIPVDYVPETPNIEVPKADYLIPAFARPDYQPTPITPPVEETPAPVENNTYEQPAAPQYEAPQQPRYEETSYPQYESSQQPVEKDPFAFFGLPDTMPVSQPQKNALNTPTAPVEAPIKNTNQNVQPAYMGTEPQYVQQPVVGPMYAPPAYTPPVYEKPAPQPAAPVVEQAIVPPAQPVATMPQPTFGPIEQAGSVNNTIEAIPGFASIPGFSTAPAQPQPQPQQPRPEPTPTPTAWTPPVAEQPYVAPLAPVVVAPENNTPEAEPEVAPMQPAPEPQVEIPVEQAPPVPKAPLRFVDPKPVEEKKPVDDDEELPPPPVVPLPPKRGLFSRKPKTIDRFHNEDGGLK